MRLPPPPRRRSAAPGLLPMINVVFLLVVFFLLAARLAGPEALAVTPPAAAAGDEAAGRFTLLIAADGTPAWRQTTGEPALQALAAARADHCATRDCAADPPRLTIRADAALRAARLAGLLPRLQALGFGQMELVARPTGEAP
ncbi:MAG: biopolymer transporter ExbD [Rhodobacterales bacterium]|nr:biopolymer transporter ExbD [Rhodobacterales bacterium]